MKRILATLLTACILLFAAACGSKDAAGPGTNIFTPDGDHMLDGPGSEADPPAELQPEEMSTTFTKEEWPVVDGATAFLPFYQEMTARMLGITNEEAAEYLMCSTTDYAYPNLWQRKADIIFCLGPSHEQVNSAAEAGVEFAETPFAREGFVFFVNKDNPVDDISCEQLHDIYAGKITNWKELGGNDEEIIAYQRTEGSGSQTGLYLHIINQAEVQEPPKEKRISTMGEIIDAVAGYENAEGAIGYSYRYFVTNMHYDDQIKMLKVEGVYPDYDSIADGSYPLISNVSAVFRKDEPEDSAVRKIADWCRGPQGAWLAKELGYVPKGEVGAPLVSRTNEAEESAVTYAKGNPCPECTVMHTYFENNIETQELEVESGADYASFIRISGLKDKEVERQINRLIEERFYELYEAELPPYPGVKTRLAMIEQNDGEEGYSESNYCNAYVTGNFNNMLSIQFNKTVSRFYFNSDVDMYDECYIVDYRTLNVDLNTGREIFIGDLFADGVDGIAYINEKIAEESDKPEAFDEPTLGWYDGSNTAIHFRRAFEGIDPDQKYYIDTYTGDLNIVLDYENPEIACNFTPTVYSIDMLGINAYESRFMSPESLFTDEVPSPCLFEVPFKDLQNVESYTYIEDWIPEYHVDLSIDLTIYDDMCAGAKSQMSKSPDKRMKKLEEYVRERCAYLKAIYGDTLNSSASYYAYANRYGSYTNTSVTQGFWAADSSWNYVDDMNQTTLCCFAPDAYTPMGLNDLFVPDCDMYDIMEKTVVENLKNLLGDWGDDSTYVNMYREVMTSLNGFNLTHNSIVLDCPSVNDIICTYLPYESENYEVQSCLRELPYRDLGMENLTIFN